MPALADTENSRTLSIMAVDDDRILLAKLRACLPVAGYRLIAAPSAETALSLMADERPALALVDVSMPGMSGLDLAPHLRRKGIPFLFLSACHDAAIAREAAARGALGYLVKPADVRHVIPAIEIALQRADEIHSLRRISGDLAAMLAPGRRVGKTMRSRLQRMITEHAGEMASLQRRLAQAQARINSSLAQTQALARIANEDALTGLPNRNWLLSFLPAAMKRSRGNGCMLALLYMDLDGFKAINDGFGHAAGDELLQAVACRLQTVLKPTDHIARLGGDEFVALVEQVRHESDAEHVAQRLANALRNPFELSYGRSEVGVSVGIALYPRDASSENALLHVADLAMYSAKSNEGGCYRFYRPELANLHGCNGSKQ
jgi:diguanylate cyclase (GGDEF)-like protein